jgi:hypothetical protein
MVRAPSFQLPASSFPLYPALTCVAYVAQAFRPARAPEKQA